MNDACFFNVEAANFLQHIAVVFEFAAIGLLYSDRKTYDSDIGRSRRLSVLSNIPAPKKDRSVEFRMALVVGVLAVLMEIYQLLSQYIGC